MVAFALTVAPGTGAAACPPPVRETPRYPARQLIGGVSGTTLVLARIDGCGRVLEVKVSQGSGVEALDAEALPTVRGWVLSPAQREPVGGGPWVQMPVQLGG